MTKQPSVPPENVKDEPSIGADNVKGPRVWQAFWSGLALSFAWIKGPDREQDDEYLDLVEKSYADKLEAELREAKAEVERLKAQDLTHAVIASDIKLREERDALAKEIERLKAEVSQAEVHLTARQVSIDALAAERDRLAAQSDTLAGALEFYAEPLNWDEIWIGDGDDEGDCSCRIDFCDVELKRDSEGSLYYSTAGLTARKALAQIDTDNGEIDAI